MLNFMSYVCTGIIRLLSRAKFVSTAMQVSMLSSVEVPQVTLIVYTNANVGV